MAFQLMDLPYPEGALSPHISQETVQFHYGKHHKGYVDKLNGQIQGTEWEKASLEEIVRSSQGPVFNNAAQVWNHDFYWKSLSPKPSEPKGDFLRALEKSFGSFEQFKKDFTGQALSLFGSGWVWLVKSGEGLKIVSTANAAAPLTTSDTALLTCDVWEHAYYIDHRNLRPEYLNSFWRLANFDFAEKRLNESQ